MSVFGDFVARLETATGNTRVYGGSAPDGGTMPYVVYNRIGSEHHHHLLAASGLVDQSMQVDVYAASHSAAWPVAELIRATFDGFRGSMGDTAVKMCHLQSDRDSFIAPTDASQVGRHRISMDFIVTHTETVPTF